MYRPGGRGGRREEILLAMSGDVDKAKGLLSGL